MIRVTPRIALEDDELQESFVRASGPGGQNVNKVATAVELRFDLARSPSIPDPVKARLAGLAGSRLTKDGVIVIFSQEHRTQERNRAEAREKLFALIREAAVVPRVRRPTKPTKASKERRLAGKTIRSGIRKNRSVRPADD
ncbi:alternative ribosome rescue aminoacyl-tRNA hydrolase ArfB [Nostoc sp. NIES-2111]